jgi:hypothetical protein
LQLGFPVRSGLSVQPDQPVQPIIPAVQPQPKSLLEMCSTLVAKRCKLLEAHQLGLPKTLQEMVEEIQLRERIPYMGLPEWWLLKYGQQWTRQVPNLRPSITVQDLRPSIPAQDLRPSRSISRSPVARSRMRSRTQSLSSRTAVGSFRPRSKSLPPQLKQQV